MSDVKMNRNQLITVVEVMFNGAVDKIQSCLPTVISVEEYNQNKDVINSYIHGVVQTVGIQLPVLYATLTDDGMGTNHFPQFDEFNTMANDYIQKQTGDNPDPNDTFPDIKNLAAAFVDWAFVDYLKGSITERERFDQVVESFTNYKEKIQLPMLRIKSVVEKVWEMISEETKPVRSKEFYQDSILAAIGDIKVSELEISFISRPSDKELDYLNEKIGYSYHPRIMSLPTKILWFVPEQDIPRVEEIIRNYGPVRAYRFDKPI